MFDALNHCAMAAAKHVVIGKTRSRQLNIDRQSEMKVVIANGGKPEQSVFQFSMLNQSRLNGQKEDRGIYIVTYFPWLYLRYINIFSQNHPTFPGWLAKLNKRKAKNTIKNSRNIFVSLIYDHNIGAIFTLFIYCLLFRIISSLVRRYMRMVFKHCRNA